MLKNLRIALCAIFLILHLQANTLTEEHSEMPTQEIEVTKTMNNLLFYQGNILVQMNNSWIPIHALIKNGDQWIAKADIDSNNLSYCPRLHPLCRLCGQCHTMHCWYYVKPCYRG